MHLCFRQIQQHFLAPILPNSLVSSSASSSIEQCLCIRITKQAIKVGKKNKKEKTKPTKLTVRCVVPASWKLSLLRPAWLKTSSFCCTSGHKKSSAVFRATRYCTATLSCCPMRCARSSAWVSTYKKQPKESFNSKIVLGLQCSLVHRDSKIIQRTRPDWLRLMLVPYWQLWWIEQLRGRYRYAGNCRIVSSSLRRWFFHRYECNWVQHKRLNIPMHWLMRIIHGIDLWGRLCIEKDYNYSTDWLQIQSQISCMSVVWWAKHRNFLPALSKSTI